VNAIRSGRRTPSTVAAGDKPRVKWLQGQKKIAAQGLSGPVLRETRCGAQRTQAARAVGQTNDLRTDQSEGRPVTIGGYRTGAVRDPG
jgi:hypothetical protein